MENTKTIAKARQGLRGTIEIPGDKSISHRSVMFSALGSTPVHITNFLHAQDCLSTAACMKALGASVEFESETSLVVCGHGLHGLREASTIIDAGNSGTTLRLIQRRCGLPAGRARLYHRRDRLRRVTIARPRRGHRTALHRHRANGDG